MAEQNKLRVLFFSTAQAATGGSREVEVECPPEADQEAVWATLIARFPGLGALKSSCRLAKNGTHLTSETRFRPGDEVAVLPPVSGG